MRLSSSQLLSIQLILFLFLSNLALHQFTCRQDISGSRRLTLSNATKEKLIRLKSPLFLDAYYSSDLPIEYIVRLELIKEFLSEVEKQNPEKIRLNFYNPNKSPEIRKKALDAGLFPNEIQKTSETAKSFQEAFMGLVIKYDTQTEVLSDFFFIEEAESQIVRSLRRIDQKRKIQTICIATDNGIFETPLPGSGSGVSTWGVFYHQAFVEEYGSPTLCSLNNSPIPFEIKVLLVVGSPEWSDNAKQRIDEFLMQGGRVIFLLSPMQFQVVPVRNKDGLAFVTEKLVVPSVGFPFWTDSLKFYGFDLQTDMLFDFEHPVSLSNAKVSQKQYYPLWHYLYKAEGNLHENHPLTNNIDLLVLPWVSSLKIENSKQPNYQYETLLWSDKQVWKKEDVFSLSANQNFTKSEIERIRVPMAVLGKGMIHSKFSNKVSNLESKIFVLSSPYFLSDVLSLPEFRTLFRSANVTFLLNVIDYMLDDHDFLLSRNKKIAVLPLKSFTNQEKTIYSFFNTLFLPFLLVVFAMRRVQKRFAGNKR
jgi:ABC-type uncharacterized transport system involved in gliding motility auxiliary subunit